MGYRLDRTWAGAGVKVGGIAFIGADTFEGVAFRLDTWPTQSAHEVNATNIRLGIGLGGGVGASLVFVFNAGTLWEINGLLLDDWGINLALPGAKIGVGKISWPVLKGLSKGGQAFIKGFTPKALQDFRTLALSSTLFCTTSAQALI